MAQRNVQSEMHALYDELEIMLEGGERISLDSAHSVRLSRSIPNIQQYAQYHESRRAASKLTHGARTASLNCLAEYSNGDGLPPLSETCFPLNTQLGYDARPVIPSLRSGSSADFFLLETTRQMLLDQRQRQLEYERFILPKLNRERDTAVGVGGQQFVAEKADILKNVFGLS